MSRRLEKIVYGASAALAETRECRMVSFDRVDTGLPDLQANLFYGLAIL
jgi:hypothetical protein